MCLMTRSTWRGYIVPANVKNEELQLINKLLTFDDKWNFWGCYYLNVFRIQQILDLTPMRSYFYFL